MPFPTFFRSEYCRKRTVWSTVENEGHNRRYLHLIHAAMKKKNHVLHYFLTVVSPFVERFIIIYVHGQYCKFVFNSLLSIDPTSIVYLLFPNSL